MGDQKKKSESELKVMIKELEERIIRMERAFHVLGRRLEGAERHPEDDGWFD
jgi:hypothetical protein